MATSTPQPAVKNFVISGTNFWNPGDDFVREGVIAVLRRLFPDVGLNFLFYNFNADFFPQEKFSGISNLAARGDLDRCREHIDGVVIAGLSAGDEIKDLYRWVIANELQDRVYLIGAGYENSYVAGHIGSEPEATIFKNARIVTGRTARTPAFIRDAGVPYVHLNCPAILSVPEVKPVSAGKKIERIGFSIQLPHGQGLVNHSCAREPFELAMTVLKALSRTYAVELVAHHKSEYFHFLDALRGTDIPVRFSSFFDDLFDIYRRYDLVVTTRLHASLFANGHGIPGIIINDTDRHTHALEGFPHSAWVNTRDAFDRAFEKVGSLNLARIAEEAREFKGALMAKYVAALAPSLGNPEPGTRNPEPPQAVPYQFDSELKEQSLVRRLVRPGMTVFDVGAHAGKYTKLFSLLTGREGRVCAFEPTPASCARLGALIGSEKLSNVTLVNQAVCERVGRVTLQQFPDEYSSWNSLGQPQMENPKDPSRRVPIAGSVEVEATTLDAFCRAHGIERIDYLKLDVEGAEFRALEGARSLLERKAIRHLQFEISQRMLEGLNTTARRVFQFLEECGYECHAITDSGEVGERRSDSTAFYENYIAVPTQLETRNPKPETADTLPVHFFTIVLNGRPFIEQHVAAFEKLPFRWHWHIVEGVAELAHDTAWSRAHGGRITDALHRSGLSHDGTTEYLDELARRFPERVTIYRKPGGAFWDGKLEMVNAPLANIREECLLWQVDVDELWTTEQISFARKLFLARPDKTAAFYFCHYFVGPELVVTTRDTYGNNTGYEWLRTWRFKPGCRWVAHEPPRLCQPNARGELADVATINPFRHHETEALDLVFQHFAYTTEAQLAFKEVYYGYAGAVEQWRRLQAQKQFPVRLRDHFSWVKDGAEVNTAASQGIVPLFEFRVPGSEFRVATPAINLDPERGIRNPEPARILYVRTDAIGDAVLSGAMLRALRTKFPQAKLAVLCQEHVGNFYEACPFANYLITFDKARAKDDATYRRTILDEIALFDPDLVLNPIQSGDALTEEMVLSHARADVVGLAGDCCNISPEQHRDAKRRYSRLIQSPDAHRHELDRHRDFLAGLGIDCESLQPSIWTAPEDEQFAEEFFERNKLDASRTIALFPGSLHDCKVYPRFAEALKPLADYRFVILGGPEVATAAHSLAASLPAINATGQTSIRQMAAIIRRCAALVGTDSAGAHIACAVGTPNAVVLGGGHFGRFFPYSPLTSVACLPLDCYGCSWACRHQSAHCVKDIAPEVVSAAVRATLERRATTPRVFMQGSSAWPVREDLPRWQEPKALFARPVECIEVGAAPVQPAKPPLVSVIVSAYNAERYIRACLEDLEAQTIAEQIEIIVIDSGSPQNERAIVEEFQQRYSNIRYERTERETLYAAWNRAIAMARGKYIANANTDDAHRPDALEKLVAALEAAPEADLAYGDYYTTGVPNDSFANPRILRHAAHPPYQPATLLFYCVTGCHPMWRRTVFDKIGLFDPTFTAPGDYEFLLRFAKAGLRAVHVPEPLSLFYQNPDGLSFQRGSKADQEFKAIQARYRAEMPIERLYPVGAIKPRELAKAWIALGNLAMRCEVPWLDNVSQDVNYARQCYLTALNCEPGNAVALHNLAVAECLGENSGFAETLRDKLPAETFTRLQESIQRGALELLEADATSTKAAKQGTSVRMPVRWLGAFFAEGAEAAESRALVCALEPQLIFGALDATPQTAFSHRLAASFAPREASLLRTALRNYPLLRGGISVSDAAPPDFQRPPEAQYAIGRTHCRHDELPATWARLCNLMDEIWVRDEVQRERFARGGVEADKLVVVGDPEAAVVRFREIERKLTTPSCPPATGRVCKPEPVTLAKGAKPLHVAWEGSFLDFGSLSHVNRELTRELSGQSGVQLACVGRNSLKPDSAKELVFQEMARRLQPQAPKQTQITVRHAWPPNWETPSGAWVLIQPWEFGALPAEWTRQLGRVDEIWAPSEYVRRVYVDSGLPPAKVKIVPNGIDPARFRPDAPPLKLATSKSFKFLFVGGTIARKGPDVLLDAFLKSFTAADDVCLVIKDFGGGDVYAGQTAAAQIKAAQARTGAPEILYLTDDLSPEQVAGLYTACDCLVHPYRGEGFGLPVLEAMACGLPVVVTGGGATDDFATDEFAFRLPALRKPTSESVGGMALIKPGWWLEPDADALAQQMRWMVAHRDEARSKGRRVSEFVRNEWTWERAAQIAAHRLHDLAARKDAERAAIEARRARKPAPIRLPAVARIGQLDQARQQLAAGEFVAAWRSAAEAIEARPFHPEAWLLLAEIAHAAGDDLRAADCAKRARTLAPRWKAAKEFAKKLPAKPARAANAQVWPDLPALQSRAPRLTVCTIVKNEEQFLPRCLASVRSIAQQVVVVDTGSTDRTMEIAGEFGAEVHSAPWTEDFSAARNVSLEYARGDWILILDADEEMPAASIERLRKEIQNEQAIAYRLPIVERGAEAEGQSYVPRLFRNAPGLYFTGRIHEQVFGSIEKCRREWELENKLGTTSLVHHGYNTLVQRQRDKVARNLKLLEQALEENPNDPNLLMNYGLELMRSGQRTEALAQYAEAVHALSALPANQVVPELRETLLTQYATYLLAGKDNAAVARLFESRLAKSASLTASMHFLAGLALIEQQKFSEAAGHMRQCLARRDEPALSPIHKDVRTAAPRHCLALCLKMTQQPAAAHKAFAEAVAEQPDSRPLRFDFARFLAEHGEPVEALKLYHQLIGERGDDIEAWVAGGRAALSRPECLEFARDWTGEALKHFSTHPVIVAQRAEALLLSGEIDEAAPFWQALAAGADPRALAALTICRVLRREPCQLTEGAEEAVSAEFLKWYRALLGVGAQRIVNGISRELSQLRRVLPSASRVVEAVLREAGVAAAA